MQYYFHSSSFHLYSILFIAPTSIYSLLFSSLQLLFKQHYLHHSSFHLSFQLLVNTELFNESMFHLRSVIFIRLSSFFNNIEHLKNLSSFPLRSVCFIHLLFQLRPHRFNQRTHISRINSIIPPSIAIKV